MSKFKDWKQRCSSLGKILTNEPGISETQHNRIAELTIEKETKKNKNGNTVKWTDNKEKELKKLTDLRDADDVLPKGAITYLDGVFRDIFWGRKRSLYNNYLDKGIYTETACLSLSSKLDGCFYEKNTKRFENDFLTGEPDTLNISLRDEKANYDLESFENAELISLYKWQLRGYLILLKRTDETAYLDYCLVNNPLHQIISKKQKLFFDMNTPDETDLDYIKEKQQLERNMIFDINAFKSDYPNYDFENKELNFDIPPIYRRKVFEVSVTKEQEKFAENRVKLTRKYLLNKEKEVLELIKK